jgi:glycosyltransferase involved in cell wall biosynthesis
LIGIDGNEANVPNRVGSNQYAFGVLWGIYHVRPTDCQFIIYLKQPPLADLPQATSWWQYKVIPSKFAWTQWRLPLELFLGRPRPQVLYTPGHYAPRISPIPVIVSIMDVAFLKLPKLFLRFKRGAKQLADWTKYSVHKATHIIAISEHTKQDVVECYQIDPQKITVAYPGVDTSAFKMPTNDKKQEVKNTYQLPDKYVVHVGTLQPRKNIKRLITAFENLPNKHKNCHLVLVGQIGWMAEDIMEAIAKSPKHDRIHHLGYVKQEDIPAIIASAEALVLVGLYEGFGMPPAEGIACGTIPIVSNNSSLPEVVGEAGIKVDPYSVASITHGIIAALELTTEQKINRISSGQKHIMKFNWDDTARIILEVILKVQKTV